MKKFAFILTLLSASVFGQTFEGKIFYNTTYESKLPNMSSEQFTVMMGNNQEYLTKNGNYKSITNGKFLQWQLYSKADRKLYTKMANSEIIFWNDVSINADEVVKIEINKAVTKVLGYTCDEVVLTCKSGIQKYYFNTAFGVDISLFEEHLYGNWYNYLKEAKAFPLKSIIENAQFTLVSTATEIKEMKLDDKEFQLPENSKTEKSTF
ncbi:hypothetical protein [Flavobacterium difficile]|uniref:DUF4412 domain-containing protein n=1 Tax=Flavobacterium difficile TaxID=2709659 RepID=A0ABX0I3X5_9FLAO|nr:hypothetical protein [Flavobacterium difficile]NHM00853.1 hypothetical protein [Flavobacterium difficile]